MKDIIKKIAFDVTHSNRGLFEEAFETLIFEVLSDLNGSVSHLFRNASNTGMNLEKIYRSLARSFVDDITEVFASSFILKLYEKKPTLVGENSKQRYRDYVERFLKNDFEQLFIEGTQYSKIAKIHSQHLVYNVVELFERFVKDKEQIQESFGFEIGSVDSIKVSMGDSHNHGRNVAIFYVDKEPKFVYKPHSINNDIIVSDTMKWVNSTAGLKCDMKSVEFLAGEGYGWEKFVDSRSCEDENAVQRYMYRLGSLIFISYLYGSTDLHMENIIADGEYPIIIDNETLCSNSSGLAGKIQELKEKDNWTAFLSDSVFQSMLVPHDVVVDDHKEDISGLFGGENRNVESDEKARVLVNLGTDDIRFDYVNKLKLVVKNNGSNRAKIHEKNVSVSEYLKDVVEGFEDCYCQFMKNRESFLQAIETFGIKNGFFRIVVRNTALYNKYLIASHHPKYMTDLETRKRVFACLKGKNGYISDCHEKVVNEEIEQLLNEDVPYFFTDYFSTSLFSADGKEIKNFFNHSIKDELSERIKKLSEIDLYKEIYFLKCSISNDVATPKNVPATFIGDRNVEIEEHNFNEAARQFICDILNFREQKHRILGKQNQKLFFSVALGENRARLGIEFPTIYEGGGSVLFYLFLQRIFGNKYLELSKTLLNEYTSENFEPIVNLERKNYYGGLFNGSFSRIYLTYIGWRILGQEGFLEKIKQDTALFYRELDRYNMEFDVLNGYSGIVIFALNAWSADKRLSEMFDLAKECGKKLFEMFAVGAVEPQTGWAHGYTGASSALIYLGDVLGNSEYYEMGISLIQKENQLFDKERREWKDTRTMIGNMSAWCHGAPGVLIGRTYSYMHARNKDKALIKKDIERCLSKIREDITGGTGQEILCHGTSGNLDVLLWYSKISQDESLRRFIEIETQNLLKRIIKDGICFKNNAKVPDITFMIGMTGVGYYFERYLNNSIPCVLSLEAME